MSGQMLQKYRVLDLADRESQLCGRILADLGADVIRIERPGGDASRHVGPFYGDIIHPEKSVWWYVLNANKRGITLNLESQDGRKLFKKLAEGADFVIESYKPGYLAGLGLDYPALSQVNPRLIVTSITPFGQTGPYHDFKSSELVLMALGIFMYSTGDPDRPPVTANFPLAGITASIAAFSATMIAHYYRLKSGQGQHIDTSAQAAPPWFVGAVGIYPQLGQGEIRRAGPSVARRPDLQFRSIWACKDGYVIFPFRGGVAGRRTSKALAQWMAEEGIRDEYFDKVDWDNLDILQATQDMVDKLEKPIGVFLLTKTKQELAEQATGRGILMGYVDSMGELLQNPQLASGFWKEIEHPELKKSITYPGHFLRSSIVECGIRYRAPLIGEHNREIYGEIGISKEHLLSLNQAGVI